MPVVRWEKLQSFEKLARTLEKELEECRKERDSLKTEVERS
jgi:uncharacterized membrane protein (DUF106 family)